MSVGRQRHGARSSEAATSTAATATGRPASRATAQAQEARSITMSMLVWVMMGIAIWHFTIFFPDRFYGGIVGAFLAAIFGRRDLRLCRQRASRSRPPRHPPRPTPSGGSGRADRARDLVLVASSERAEHRSRERLSLARLLRPPRDAARLPCRPSAASRPVPSAPASLLPHVVPTRAGVRPLLVRRRGSQSRAPSAVAHRRDDPRAARLRHARGRRSAFLAGEERHDPLTFGRDGRGLRADAAPRRSRTRAIVVHGDYDVDGVVAPPRSCCARCGGSAPIRAGTCRAASTTATGSRATTVERLAAQGSGPARHRRLRDHRGRRGRDGRIELGHRRRRHRPPPAGERAARTARSCIPALRLPVPGPLRRRRRLQARRGALRGRRRSTRRWRDEDLDLVALATIADLVRSTARTGAWCARDSRRCGATHEAGAAGADASRRRSTPARSTRAPSASGSRRGSTRPGGSSGPTPRSSCC